MEKNKCHCTMCNNKLNEFCSVKINEDLYHKGCGIKKCIQMLNESV